MAFEKNIHKGHSFRKGNESPIKLKKVELYKKGLEINCKKHGNHLKWRMHSNNNVQCFHCAKEWQMNQRRRDPLKFIFRDAKRHAIYHNRIFNIELMDLFNIFDKQNGSCALTGIKFDENNPPSLDRIDSKIGYEKENIQLIKIKINVMKSNICQNEFINLCKQISAYAQAKEKKKKSKKKK